MGNTVAGGEGGGGRKKKKGVKVMKINGEFFKLNTPATAGDVTKDYPGHILLDSKDFLRYNLRGSQPLDPETELRPGRIYLLVQLPEFPVARDGGSPPPSNLLSLPRTRSTSGGESSSSSSSSGRPRMYRRSVSDLAGGSHDCDSGPLRVKFNVPKVDVERIMEQSANKEEVAQRIYGLSSMDEGVSGGRRRRREEVEAVAGFW